MILFIYRYTLGVHNLYLKLMALLFFEFQAFTLLCRQRKEELMQHAISVRHHKFIDLDREKVEESPFSYRGFHYKLGYRTCSSRYMQLHFLQLNNMESSCFIREAIRHAIKDVCNPVLRDMCRGTPRGLNSHSGNIIAGFLFTL